MNKKSPAAPNECGLNSAENTRGHSVPGACRRRQGRLRNLLRQSHIQRKVGGVLVNFTMPCDNSHFDADLLLGPTFRWHLSPRIKWLCYPSSVEITINIPDELAHQVALEGKDPARVALEHIEMACFARLSKKLGSSGMDGMPFVVVLARTLPNWKFRTKPFKTSCDTVT